MGGLSILSDFAAEFTLRVSVHKLDFLSPFGPLSLLAFLDLLHFEFDLLLVIFDPVVVLLLAGVVPWLAGEGLEGAG